MKFSNIKTDLEGSKLVYRYLTGDLGLLRTNFKAYKDKI